MLLMLAGFPLTPAGQTTHISNSGMPVTVEIIQRCQLSVPNLDFGTHDLASGAPTLGQTNISVQCGPGVHAEISLDGGTAPGSGKTTRRRMSSESGGGARLDYDLFQDAGRSIHWGDTSGEDTLEFLSTGLTQSVPIYGQIPGGQRVKEGYYSDMITVRLQF